ncbi:excisionase [Bradyrhizobium sp. 186]|uniref:excisionase n=1 Tax=Bradyrhizobium sp. 186 TaxID=2782654 RepID=UPI002000CE0C|nr:excisionase [Bradyrhizobium sp. 186]
MSIDKSWKSDKKTESSSMSSFMIIPVPANDNIGPDHLLPLKEACKVAFPRGGMTVSGLRREAARGHLVVMRIANRDFTTLRSIQEMGNLCRVAAEDLTSIGGANAVKLEKSSAVQHGSSSTAASMLPRDALLAKIQRHKSA